MIANANNSVRIISASLCQYRERICGILTDLSHIPSVGLCKCRSVGLSDRKVYIVAKQLSGSGCRLG